MPTVHASPEAMAQLACHIVDLQTNIFEDIDRILSHLDGPLSDAWHDSHYSEFRDRLRIDLSNLANTLEVLGLLAHQVERRCRPLEEYLRMRFENGGVSKADVTTHTTNNSDVSNGFDISTVADWLIHSSSEFGKTIIDEVLNEQVLTPWLGGTLLSSLAGAIMLDVGHRAFSSMKDIAGDYRNGRITATHATARILFQVGIGIGTGFFSTINTASVVSLFPQLSHHELWVGALASHMLDKAVNAVERRARSRSGS